MSSEIVYAERICPVCGEAVGDKQTYDKDECRKRADRARAALERVHGRA